MSYSTIILEVEEKVARITLNRPDKRNAFNELMNEEFLDSIRKLEDYRSVRVLIITGAGKVFCSGADISEVFLKGIEDRKQGKEPYDIAAWTRDARTKLMHLSIPTIASMNGPAVGLGFTLALACDLRIACEEVIMAIPFTRFNILPEFGSSYLLPRLVGIAKACELALTGRPVSAQEAKEIGLVNCVVPSSELQKTTNEIAESIAQGAPLGTEMTKKALYQGMDNDLKSQLQHEYLALNQAFRTEDHHEGVKAFLEKRPPVFKGV